MSLHAKHKNKMQLVLKLCFCRFDLNYVTVLYSEPKLFQSKLKQFRKNQEKKQPHFHSQA